MTITPEVRKERLNELRRNGVAVPNLTDEQLASPIPPKEIVTNLNYAYLYDEPRARDFEGTYQKVEWFQEAWAKSKYFVDGMLERRAQREADAKAAEQAKADADRTRREQEATELKADLRKRFLSLPGTTPEQFETEYPQLLNDHYRRQMDERASDEARARQDMRTAIRSMF